MTPFGHRANHLAVMDNAAVNDRLLLKGGILMTRRLFVTLLGGRLPGRSRRAATPTLLVADEVIE
jgi:hypothetical protein